MSGGVFYDKIITMNKKNKIIVMMAGPGAGKGTLSEMLMADGDYVYIGVGAILRSKMDELGISEMMSSGNLVPDGISCGLVASEISGAHDFILDGFPRNLIQAKWLVENYSDKYELHIIYMHVPELIMRSRIKKRLNDGAGRADDVDEEIINRRIKTFSEITLPAIDWLRTVPNIFFDEIDAASTPVEIFREIKSVL